MKLYYSKGACSLAVRIIINELELPCEFEAVNLASKETETGKNYYTINPKGAVPALTVGNNETITENAVIMQYLADTNKAEQLLPFVGNLSRYRVLEWLNYVGTELHKSFGPLFNAKFPQELKDTMTIPLLISKFKFINGQLEKTKYLCGDHFTLPDAYLYVMLTWARHFKFNFDDMPHLAKYSAELFNRKSIQLSLKQEGFVLEK